MLNSPSLQSFSYQEVHLAIIDDRFDLNSFLLHVTIFQLVDVEVEGTGRNLLWLFARYANQKPELFHAIWEKFNNDLTLKDFRPKHEGKTALWFLAHAARQGNSQIFFAVWNKLKAQLSYDDLEISGEAPGNNGDSLINLIKWLEGGNRMLLEAITQIPGIPSEAVREDLANISQAIKAFSQTLFSEKIRFYSFLEKLKPKKILAVSFEEQDIVTLFQLADAAFSAGYMNAFYEIYQFLAGTSFTAAQSRAFSKLYSLSWYPLMAVDSRAKLYFDTALTIKKDVENRDLLLLSALSFAVQMQGKERAVLIQAIAYCYITQKNDVDPTFSLPPNLLNDKATLVDILENLSELRKQSQPCQTAAQAAASPSSEEMELTRRFTGLSFSTTSVAAAAAASAAASSSGVAVKEATPQKIRRQPKQHQ